MNVTTLDNLSAGWAEAMWRACCQGAIFVGVVWLVCRMARGLPVALRCWLWWLACLKLLLALPWTGIALPVLPVQKNALGASATTPSLESVLSTTPYLPATQSEIRGQVRVPAPSRWQGGETFASAASGQPAWRMPSGRSILFILWTVGGIGCLVVAMKQIVSLRSLLADSESLDDSELGMEVRRLGIELGLTSPPRVLATSRAAAPLVHGVAQPILILPKSLVESLSPAELRMLAAHELAHVRRRDLWLLSVPLLARAIFFFFPPAWVACRGWQAAQEAACDAEAVAVTETRPAAYADLLIRVAAQDVRGGLLYALGATAAYHTLRERLMLLRNAGSTAGTLLSPLTSAAGVAALALVIPLTFTHRSAALAPVTHPQLPSIEYTLTDLGTLGGEESQARSINSDGAVVGWAKDTDELFRPVVWFDGKIRPLPMPPAIHEGDALAINDAGVVAVRYMRAGKDHDGQAYICAADSEPQFMDAFNGDPFTVPQALNNSGTVVGGSGEYGGAQKACAWQANRKEMLQIPNCTQATASGVNDSGIVVGTAERDGAEHALIWFNRQYMEIEGLGAQSSSALAINNHNQIVGYAGLPGGGRHGFLYEDGSMRDLGTLGGSESVAVALNDRGQLVGGSRTGADAPHAFLWERARGMVDLNEALKLPAGWSLQGAGGINESGQIAGTAIVNGLRRAFLLTPIHMRRYVKAVRVIPAEEWLKPPQSAPGRPLPEMLRELESKIVRSATAPDIYLIMDGKRRLIPTRDPYHDLPDWSVYSSLFGTRNENLEGNPDFVIVPDLQRIPLGEPLAQGTHLAKAPGSDKIYLVSNGTRRWIVNDEARRRFSFQIPKREESLESMGREGPIIR